MRADIWNNIYANRASTLYLCWVWSKIAITDSVYSAFVVRDNILTAGSIRKAEMEEALQVDDSLSSVGTAKIIW